MRLCVVCRPSVAGVVLMSCKTCDHSISQAFNGAAARGEAHLARIPDPFEAPRAKTIDSTTNIAIGEAHLALFVTWCPGGARSMFRTVSQIRARIGQFFIVTNTPASRQRSDRAPASLVEAGEGIDEGILRKIDLRVESPRGALHW